MNPSSSPSWPTTLFRTVRPDETEVVRRLLGLDDTHGSEVYVLVQVDRRPDLPPRAGVAVDVRDGTWLIRSAYGVDDPQVAARLGNDLLTEAVRAGAVSVATPAEAGTACRALLADGRGRRDGGWIVAEL